MTKLESIFKKIDLKDEKLLGDLFSLSLVDPSSYEIEPSLPKLDGIRNNITKLINKHGKSTYRNHSKLKNDVIKSEFYTGKIVNYIIEIYLTKAGIKNYSEHQLSSGHSTDVYVYDTKISLEVKRIVTSGQIYAYIDETKNKYPASTSEVNKVLMFFLFREDSQSRANHFKWAVDGYRGLFQALKSGKKIPGHFEFYIDSYSVNTKDLQNFMDKLVMRINKVGAGSET